MRERQLSDAERAATLRPRVALDDVVRRFVALPLVDQLEFSSWLEQYLARSERPLNDQRLRQREVVKAIRSVMEHLDTEGILTVAAYEEGARELGLELSWQQIHRFWGSFADAASVAAGTKRPPLTAQERAFMSRYAQPHRRRREEPFHALRIWLATQPSPESGNAYDAFARAYNLTLQEGELPLPRRATLQRAQGLRWEDVVHIARGEIAQSDAIRERVLRRDWSRGPHRLIGLGTIGLLAGRAADPALRLTRESDFPRPALVLCHRRAWLYDEVTDYLRGERQTLQEANRLRGQYLSAREVAAMIGATVGGLGSLKDSVAPSGQVAGARYWLRSEVDAWVKENAARVAVQQARRRRPGAVDTRQTRTDFVTLMALARELRVTIAVGRGLIRRADFPPPVARFGDAGIWRRSDVLSYLRGEAATPREATETGGLEEPTPELQSEFVDSHAVAEMLGYPTMRSFYNACDSGTDLPMPAARVGQRKVWRRGDVHAWLAADPNRAASVDRRRGRKT